jgi:molybdate transport system substrate-binding protein
MYARAFVARSLMRAAGNLVGSCMGRRGLGSIQRRVLDMRRRWLSALMGSAALLCAHGNAGGAELTVFVTGSMADPFEELGEGFTHASGHTVRFSRGTTNGVLAKIQSGERGDVIVVTAEAAAELERNGTVVAGSLAPVASSLFGVVVRADRPSPDVSTPEAFKEAVLSAPTISYPDPKAATVSGGYIETVLAGLGILDDARRKASLKPMGYLVGEAVESGEAALGLSFISEFTSNPRLAVVRFPAALQKPQPYSAGVLTHSPNAALARELIAFVTSAAARETLSAAGVVPASSTR